MQGTVRGVRDKADGRRGGKNIREWTALEFAKSQRAVEDREKWRKLVVKSSVVPQRPLRLGDLRGWRLGGEVKKYTEVILAKQLE